MKAASHPALATAAMLQAALELQQILTPHAIAIDRAGQASQQLDRYMASMQGIGILKLQCRIQTATGCSVGEPKQLTNDSSPEGHRFNSCSRNHPKSLAESIYSIQSATPG